jgi:hypothetical protein
MAILENRCTNISYIFPQGCCTTRSRDLCGVKLADGHLDFRITPGFVLSLLYLHTGE